MAWLALLLVAAACTPGTSRSERAARGERDAGEAGRRYEADGGDEEEGHGALTETEDLLGATNWFYSQRMAPGRAVPVGALGAAFAQADALEARFAGSVASGPTWTSLGPRPVNTEDARFSDINSNGSVYQNGFGVVSGRVTAIAVSPANPNVVYVGGAGGGVWKSTNAGSSWKPIGDRLPSLAIGSIAVSPANPSVVLVGTGEANTNQDSYFGLGVFRSGNGGGRWRKVGGATFDGATVFRLAFAGGAVFAASNHGLYRSTDVGRTWSKVLAPGGAADPYGNFATDVVALDPSGTQILAALGWRGNPGGGADPNNGLWLSTDSGATFAKVTAAGFPAQQQLGRISLAAMPSQPGLLYAVIQDASLMNSPAPTPTVLNGVYKSTNGPAGPWQQVATSSTFASDPNSALSPPKIGQAYQPGIQSWYNQYVVIDPTDPNDVVVGLEEIYASHDGGGTWHTIGRYWNVCAVEGTPGCFLDPIQHPTTHPDQHAAAFGVAGGKPLLYVGNDGGVWSQTGPAWSNDSWNDLNAGLAINQPYYVESSAGPNPVIYAGAQDNGSVKYEGSQTWPQIFGGDGGDVAVEPNHPNNAYEEYVYLQMSRTQDGGQHWTNDIGPSDSGSASTARFIAPFDMDPLDQDHLVALGQHVWESHAGIGTTSSSWTSSFDFGSGHLGTALGVLGTTIYAGWCGPCNPDQIQADAPFARGMATNAGGTWHTVAATGLPNRYVTSVAIDPSDAQHVYATVSAFSRRWIPRAGEGHVFESTDGGQTFTDVSANLPDAPANDGVLVGGNLVVATDVGVFRLQGGTWTPFGSRLPHASVLDLALVPGGSALLAATHGRGVWSLPLS